MLILIHLTLDTNSYFYRRQSNGDDQLNQKDS